MKVDTKIQDKKLELIQWLSSLEDKAIIDKLLQFRQTSLNDWWESTHEDEKVSIMKGIEDANNRKLKPHSSTRKIYEKWL